MTKKHCSWTGFVTILLLFFALMITRQAVFAAVVQLPRTGQTGCWDGSGASISCAGTGQDGDKQKGVAWPSPRFTNPDGTVPLSGSVILDKLTGLMWPMDAGAPTFGVCTGGTKTWQGALDYVACLNSNNYLNYSDWRLSNRKELMSLINQQQTSNIAWLNGQGFSNVQASYYWSSTTTNHNSALAWIVYMDYNNIDGDLKTASNYVWPVRGGDGGTVQLPRTGQTTSYATGDDGDLQKGAAWDTATRFTDTGDGAVTDNLTGLVWLKNANCTGAAGGVSKAGGYLAWTDALTWSNHLASGLCGLSDGSVSGDWRLPNLLELESLIDLQSYDPALSAGHPFSNVQATYYWSSGTNANITQYAWLVEFYYGLMGSDDKTAASKYYVWPVRNGTSGSGVLYGSFTGGGIWKWNGSTWTQATSSNPNLMVTSGSTLYGSFTGGGIWKWDGSAWTQVTPSIPNLMVATTTTLYGSFANGGIWKWDGSAWTQVTPSIPQLLTVSGETLYGSFAGGGIWKWDGSAWTQVTPSIPNLMVATTTTLYGSFANGGIWKWDGSAWTQVTPSIPQLLTVSGENLYGSFAGSGIWKWDGSTWTQVTPSIPNLMVATATTLYGTFTGGGIWKWDGSAWTQVTPNEPASMVPGN